MLFLLSYVGVLRFFFSILLLVNAFAILDRKRVLARWGFTPARKNSEPELGSAWTTTEFDPKPVWKENLTHLFTTMRLVGRPILIPVNIASIAFLLLFGSLVFGGSN